MKPITGIEPVANTTIMLMAAIMGVDPTLYEAAELDGCTPNQMHPTRILTSTVRAEGGRYPRCPVKTAQAVPKEKIVQVMAALDGVTLHTPIRTGQVVLTDVCGTGVDVVATRDL